MADITAADVIQFLQDAETAVAHARDTEARQADLLRHIYRRGYRAGYMAARAGRPASASPETRTRAGVRRILNGDDRG